jgi:uncharacterized repeat protein (TIGR03803 family)
MTIRVGVCMAVCLLFVSALASLQMRAQELARPRMGNAKSETTGVTEGVLYSFCSQTSGNNCTDGQLPEGALVQASDGNFYGTTSDGGTSVTSSGYGGTIFKLTPSGQLTTLYSFCSRAGSSGENCTDGVDPQPSLVQGADGNLYGVTEQGGTGSYSDVSHSGTIFKITPTGVFTTLYNFCSQADCTDGDGPNGLTLGSDGNFYGTTYYGGTNPYDGITGGTFFKITSAGTLTTLYNFCSKVDCADGDGPDAALVQGSDGNFYGATLDGGGTLCVDGPTSGCGTIFKITPTGVLTTIYNFCSATNCSDGWADHSSLVEGSDGSYYGTNIAGGEYSNSTECQYGCGTIFTITAAGVLTTLHNFCSENNPGNCTDGAQALTNLILGTDGNVYGATFIGGNSVANCPYGEGCGTAFQITPGGAFTVLYNFCSDINCVDGASPHGLLEGSDGNFYGSASGGGNGQLLGNEISGGAVFELIGSPAMAGPVQLSLSNSPIDANTAVTLSWRVINAFSTTMQQCYAYVQGGYAAAGAWTGLQSGAIVEGVYSGSAQITPTDGGVYTYALTCGGVESGFVTLTVDGGTLQIVTNTLVNAVVGIPYSSQLVAEGGTPPYTWSVSSGSLPVGLSLGTSTGIIAGTPTTAQTAAFTIKVADNVGDSTTANLSIVVSTAPLQVSTTLLETGSVGTPYSTTLQATGGTPPYAWSLNSGSLPAGLSLSSAGIISGKPTTQAISSFTVKVTDSASNTAKQALSTAVYGSTIVRITTASLPNWTVGQPYSQTLAATSGTKPYTWSVYSGTLPAGLSINATTGVISGTPTTVGTSNFFIAVKGAGNYTATAQFSITISAAPEITTTLLETGAIGYSYSAQLLASGGTAPLKWSITSGTLPAGLTLNSSTGLISGKPTTAEVEAFTVAVTDAAGVSSSTSLTLTIYIDNIVRITTTSLPAGTVGAAYSATMQATSGTKPYTWSVYSGSLPAGLSLAASTGVISGTPTTAGTTNFFIGVKGAGNNTATASLSITIVQ